MTLLIPKKVKHRKWSKGRSRKRLVETRGTTLGYGNFGLQALGSSWITSRQIEAGRKSISRFVKKQGKMWIRVFPDKPVTTRPPETTLGGGKGSVDHYVFPVKPGRIIFEVDGLLEKDAREALRLAGHKMPFKTRIVKE
ncbi:MAG: 50S ribosomal protein L16 [Candidatus Colwellbacteria bacterium RIFCSPLOWO2_12_FULL_44_13]|uniref:Large ribosomal subunit protein uL16 n=3 Tax=Candidatus Colwelliibacteriota TaxID=1817904 RepID=A0A1G1Z6P6_9BACT|nr:MAG: 50S ribosomal protein L16 [Candidatus Colwellbacteria bacterium RIFCSPLOWO2_02_FULL_44_20b]OGY61520.1 MAG: 50S ribosomal protein L16 [Candidatus Colwellbacteria bacterium RIFCSPLOWO2_12_FULL_44_13]